MNGVTVAGSITLSNGQPAQIFTMGSGTMPRENGSKRWKCQILGGHLIVEYPDGTPSNDVDDIFRVTRHLVESTVLSRVATEGVGLSCTLDYCRTPEGVELAAPDVAPQVPIELERTVVTRLIGMIPTLRYAVRDFNQGLLYREDSPIYFYRVVETLAKVICHRDADLSASDWDEFHRQLGTGSSDLEELLTINKRHRHGTHDPFNKDEHKAMMTTARRFLAVALRFLDDNQRDYISDSLLGMVDDTGGH